MSIWNRAKVAAVLWAIFLLVTGVLDAFMRIEVLNYLLFHSPVFHIVLAMAFVIIAPFVVRALGLKMGGTGSADENA